MIHPSLNIKANTLVQVDLTENGVNHRSKVAISRFDLVGQGEVVKLRLHLNSIRLRRGCGASKPNHSGLPKREVSFHNS